MSETGNKLLELAKICIVSNKLNQRLSSGPDLRGGSGGRTPPPPGIRPPAYPKFPPFVLL